MPLVTPKEIFDQLKDKKMAVGAFNIHNMDYTQAVVKAAEDEKSPVILMIGEPILKYANLEMLSTIALHAARRSTQNIAVILDHGKDINNLNRCIELGVSVMVDGSFLPFEENIEFTKLIVDKAHEQGLSVEAELGSLSGVEDVEDERTTEHLTNPEKAKIFVERTNVDCLAVAIGNRHGKYEKTPVFDFNRLKMIKSLVDVPIVLHGGSGLPVEMSKRAIDLGVKKFNIGTDLKYAMCNGLKGVLNKIPMPFQPQDTFGVAREKVVEVTREKIRLFKNGCEY